MVSKRMPALHATLFFFPQTTTAINFSSERLSYGYVHNICGGAVVPSG